MDDIQLVLVVIAVIAVCLLLVSVGIWLCRKCKIGGLDVIGALGGYQRTYVRGGAIESDKEDTITIIDPVARKIMINNDDLAGLPDDLKTIVVKGYKPPVASQAIDNNPDTNPYAKKNLLQFLREYHAIPEDDPAVSAKRKVLIYRTMLSWDSEKPLPKTYTLPMNSGAVKGTNERLRYDNVKNFAVALKPFIESYDPKMYASITKSLGNASNNISNMLTTSDVKKYGGRLTNDITQLINSRNTKPIEQVVEETNTASNTLNDLSRQNEQLQLEINAMKEKLATAELQNEEIAKLQQELLDAQNKSKTLVDINAQLESTKVELKRVQQAYTDADLNYNTKIDELNKKISDVTRELTTSEAAKLGELQSQIQSLKQELATNSELHSKEKDISNKQISDANEQIRSLTEQKNKLSADMSSAEEIEKTLTKKTEELTAKLALSTSEIEGLTADKSRLIQGIKDAEAKRDANATEIARLTSLLEANSIVLKEALNSLRGEIETIKTDAKGYSSELSSMEQKIDKKIKNHIDALKLALEPRIESLEREVNNLKIHTDISPDSISKALQRNKEKALTLKTDVDQHTESISDFIAKNNAKSEELDILLGGLIKQNNDAIETVKNVKSALSAASKVTATPERPEGVVRPPKTIIGTVTDMISTALGNSPNIDDFATSVIDEAKATSELLASLANEISGIKEDQKKLKDSLDTKLNITTFETQITTFTQKFTDLKEQLDSFDKRFTELESIRMDIGKGIEEKIKAIDAVNASQDAKIAELASRFRMYEDTESVPIVYKMR